MLSKKTCPHCGCEDFFVISAVRVIKTFSVDSNKKVHIKDTTPGESEIFQQIRCAECQKSVGQRSLWEKSGIAVPR